MRLTINKTGSFAALTLTSFHDCGIGNALPIAFFLQKHLEVNRYQCHCKIALGVFQHFFLYEHEYCNIISLLKLIDFPK